MLGQTHDGLKVSLIQARRTRKQPDYIDRQRVPDAKTSGQSGLVHTHLTDPWWPLKTPRHPALPVSHIARLWSPEAVSMRVSSCSHVNSHVNSYVGRFLGLTKAPAWIVLKILHRHAVDCLFNMVKEMLQAGEACNVKTDVLLSA